MSAHDAAPATAIERGPRLELPAELGNVARHLARLAAERPEHALVVEPDGSRGWRRSAAREVDERAQAIAAGLAGRGLARGDRCAVFVPPGADLVALVFALFRLGAVPVLLDPGMGREAALECLARARPRAFLGVPLAHALRRLAGSRLASIEIDVVVGPRWIPLGTTLAELERGARGASPLAPVKPSDVAAILFTSGSTGPAKGVVYEHGMFDAQIAALRAAYAFEPGEVDLACFPLFALFAPALGLTSVFPRMDFVRPAECDPAQIVDALEAHGCTSTFGSPAIWRRVAAWPARRPLPALKRVLIAGAPVSTALVEELQRLLAPGADVHTPFGATECLPVSTLAGREILARRARAESGAGACVGRPAPGIEIAILPVTDAPLAALEPSTLRARGALGEIAVRGPVVTRAYDADPRADAASKVPSDAGPWHRMGDLGYFDDEGFLWYAGRKSQRLETRAGLVAPVPLENVYDRHPDVHRTAIVGIGERGAERAVLFVEPKPEAWPRDEAARSRFAASLARLRDEQATAQPNVPAQPNVIPQPNLIAPAIEHVLFERSFPVDARHNAKIRREDLRSRAEELLSAEGRERSAAAVEDRAR